MSSTAGDHPASPTRAAPFPLGLCLTSLTISGLGLSASVLGIQWGSAAIEGEILDRAWSYVNFSVTLLILLVWPAMRLRGELSPGENLSARMWDLCTLAIAAIPAMGVAAWLSAIPTAGLARMIALQAGFGILALGATAWRGRADGRWHAAIAGFLVLLTLVLPLLAYIQAEFAPAAPRAWFLAAPLLTVLHSAADPHASITWWMAAVWTAVGVILAGLAPRK